MQVRLPRPLRGWREFAGEVGIIVLGVGIALAADQILEGQHWKQVVEAEDEALVAEIQDNYRSLLIRVMMQPCIDRRLAEIAEVFRRREAGQPLGLIAPIGRPSRFTGGTTTLQMATADGSLSHMTLRRKQSIFDTYGSYATFLPVSVEERAGWRTLQSLDRAQTLDEADWREMRKAFDGVVDNNASMKANLKSESDGDWLTPFVAFPKPDTRALRQSFRALPYVQHLCRPALRATQAEG